MALQRAAQGAHRTIDESARGFRIFGVLQILVHEQPGRCYSGTLVSVAG